MTKIETEILQTVFGHKDAMCSVPPSAYRVHHSSKRAMDAVSRLKAAGLVDVSKDKKFPGLHIVNRAMS